MSDAKRALASYHVTDFLPENHDARRYIERLAAERDRYREALEQIVEWGTYGYQDLNSGGVLAHVRKHAREALGRAA
jgi:hypothetical protein